MKCRYCGGELPETAIRCRHCRRPLSGVVKKGPGRLEAIPGYITRFLSGGRDSEACPWTILDVLAVTAFIALFIFHDPFGAGHNIIRFLKLHFFIFTKEPRLIYYLNIYINTMIFKGISIVFILAAVMLRKVSFWEKIVSPSKVPDPWGMRLPLFLGGCFIAHSISKMNPLVPNLPFHSVFVEANIIGNIVIIFSVLAVAPFVEEVLFRGFLYPALNRYMGIFPAIIITSALFTMAHYPQVKDEYVFMAIIFIMSLVITYARAVTGSTRVAIIMHYIYNLVSVGMGFVEYIIVKY